MFFFAGISFHHGSAVCLAASRTIGPLFKKKGAVSVDPDKGRAACAVVGSLYERSRDRFLHLRGEAGIGGVMAVLRGIEKSVQIGVRFKQIEIGRAHV